MHSRKLPLPLRWPDLPIPILRSRKHATGDEAPQSPDLDGMLGTDAFGDAVAKRLAG